MDHETLKIKGGNKGRKTTEAMGDTRGVNGRRGGRSEGRKESGNK